MWRIFTAVFPTYRYFRGLGASRKDAVSEAVATMRFRLKMRKFTRKECPKW